MTATLQREIKKQRPFELPEQEAMLNVLRTADQLQIRFSRLFRRFGLTPQQYNVLRILRGEGRPLPILEIAARMITVVPGITGLIDRLEMAGLVERQRCDQDRRVIYVAITPHALTLLSRIDEPLVELHKQTLGHMTDDDLTTLTRLLEKARQTVPLSSVSNHLTMLVLRKSSDRGHINHGWLDTYHTFSFGDYYDPTHMGFRSLRVINEDRILPGGGFGMHGHRDMEIVTCVLSGALEHKDSLGNGGVLRPGELQHMSAGRGIRHSEFNPSATEPAHLYQIWLLPRESGLTPSYSQKSFDPNGRVNSWQLVASPDGAESSLQIQQDARIYLAALAAGRDQAFELRNGRHAWLQVLRGSLETNGSSLEAGDAIAASSEAQLLLHAKSPAELMLFDLA